MAIQLPTAIAAYFTADRERDQVRITLPFAEDAIVKDEGKEHSGRDAIRQWMSHAWTKYDAVAQPSAIAERGGAMVVTTHVVGNFPGSPLDLRYRFVLEGDLIARLEITL